MTRIGRNAPCPCRSGRKHKACCLERATEQQRARGTADGVWERMQGWTTRTHPEHLEGALAELFGDTPRLSDGHADLLCSYALLDRELPGGRTVAERFAQLERLSDAERAAAETLAQARLGLWRALAVQPGASIELVEVVGGSLVTVHSRNVSREARRWDVLLGRVIQSPDGGHELWGPAAVFHAEEEDELVAELHRLAAERGVTPQAAFRACAAALLRFTPQRRTAAPSFFTYEGDRIADASARWEIDDDDAAEMELHADLVDTGDTEDGEGICLEWTGERRELAARRPQLPVGALVLESAPVFVDSDGEISSDGTRIGLGTFELRPHELAFYAISTQRLDGAIALVAEATRGRARLVERRVEPLEPSRSRRGHRAAPRSPEPGVPDEVRAAVIAGFARDRFLRMLDEPDPRFEGLTPREAVQSARQRPRVERWLRTLENMADRGRVRDEAAPDVAMLRAELGLPDHTIGAKAA